MADKTGIEWTDATWNPITGCTKVSAGCDNCYAETFAERWRGTPGHYFENGFDVQFRPDKLELPLRWKRPRRIFVNSMSDLFHDQVPDEFIAKVFAIMALAPWHTFQVLTKRHARMRGVLSSEFFRAQVRIEARRVKDREWAGSEYPRGRKAEGATRWEFPAWPLPNVWLGCSAENQQWATIRGNALRETPAAVRFYSFEPLLGPVDDANLDGIHWAITGGESGPGARPAHPDWFRWLRDQCEDAGVAYLHKQNGAWIPVSQDEVKDGDEWVPGFHRSGIHMRQVGKHRAGRELDGRTWDQYPQVVVR